LFDVAVVLDLGVAAAAFVVVFAVVVAVICAVDLILGLVRKVGDGDGDYGMRTTDAARDRIGLWVQDVLLLCDVAGGGFVLCFGSVAGAFAVDLLSILLQWSCVVLVDAAFAVDLLSILLRTAVVLVVLRGELSLV
jgi:hypothetical protein